MKWKRKIAGQIDLGELFSLLALIVHINPTSANCFHFLSEYLVNSSQLELEVADQTTGVWKGLNNNETDWKYCGKLQVCCRNFLQILWPVDIWNSPPAFCPHKPRNEQTKLQKSIIHFNFDSKKVISIIFHEKYILFDKLQIWLQIGFGAHFGGPRLIYRWGEEKNPEDSVNILLL